MINYQVMSLIKSTIIKKIIDRQSWYFFYIGSHSSIKGQYNKSSSEISFNLLIRELSSQVSTDWEDIGLFLELQQGALDEISSKSSSHTKKCFREMIKLWLRQDDPPPSWSAIIDAIEELDYESLAQELKDKFL